MRNAIRLLFLSIFIVIVLSGCMKTPESSAKIPTLPEKLNTNANGEPILKVYDVSKSAVLEESIEKYVAGVIAGEMKNDWPIEALKAQAILARTFVLKFCDTKSSKYSGADISTDVSEAQAYAPENINDRIREAVNETKGLVMTANGEYPYAWFFAHAGGKTELPSVALDYQKDDPDYLSVVESNDSEKAPDNVKNWKASFTADQVRKACADAGLKLSSIESFEIGERGESGRIKTFAVNGQSVSAPSFRIAIGANKLKSTLIDSVDFKNGTITFTGRGFGHGVGMSQWGAYALAEDGENAEEIIKHYFTGVEIVRMW